MYKFKVLVLAIDLDLPLSMSTASFKSAGDSNYASNGLYYSSLELFTYVASDLLLFYISIITSSYFVFSVPLLTLLFIEFIFIGGIISDYRMLCC